MDKLFDLQLLKYDNAVAASAREFVHHKVLNTLPKLCIFQVLTVSIEICSKFHQLICV